MYESLIREKYSLIDVLIVLMLFIIGMNASTMFLPTVALFVLIAVTLFVNKRYIKRRAAKKRDAEWQRMAIINKIMGIKAHREIHNSSLVDAKNAVEEFLHQRELAK